MTALVHTAYRGQPSGYCVRCSDALCSGSRDGACLWGPTQPSLARRLISRVGDLFEGLRAWVRARLLDIGLHLGCHCGTLDAPCACPDCVEDRVVIERLRKFAQGRDWRDGS